MFADKILWCRLIGTGGEARQPRPACFVCSGSRSRKMPTESASHRCADGQARRAAEGARPADSRPEESNAGAGTHQDQRAWAIGPPSLFRLSVPQSTSATVSGTRLAIAHACAAGDPGLACCQSCNREGRMESERVKAVNIATGRQDVEGVRIRSPPATGRMKPPSSARISAGQSMILPTAPIHIARSMAVAACSAQLAQCISRRASSDPCARPPHEGHAGSKCIRVQGSGSLQAQRLRDAASFPLQARHRRDRRLAACA